MKGGWIALASLLVAGCNVEGAAAVPAQQVWEFNVIKSEDLLGATASRQELEAAGMALWIEQVTQQTAFDESTATPEEIEEYREGLSSGRELLEDVEAEALAQLNAIGAEGWQLVTIHEGYVYFQRPVE